MSCQTLPSDVGIRTIPDTERLANGITVLRCGQVREAIRAPYDLGIAAYAHQRWMRAPLGDVLAHRKRHIYFMVPVGTGQAWDALLESTGCRGMPLRLLGEGSIVVMPTRPHGKAARWLRGPHLGPARADDVLASLRHADERLIARGLQQIQTQEDAALLRWLYGLHEGNRLV